MEESAACNYLVVRLDGLLSGLPAARGPPQGSSVWTWPDVVKWARATGRFK